MRCRDYFHAHPGFIQQLESVLDKDFNAGAFDPFFRDWEQWKKLSDIPGPAEQPAEMLVGLREVLPLPLQNLWNDEQPGAEWIATRVNTALFSKLPPGAVASPNAPIDQVETLNTALRRYRVTAMQRGRPWVGHHRGGGAGGVRMAARGVHAGGGPR